MNQQSVPKAPPSMPMAAPAARPALPSPALPTAPLLRAAANAGPTMPALATAPAVLLPAVRQVTVATVTRNLQSVLGPAANAPIPQANAAPKPAFPGFVSRQFDQVKQYTPSTSNAGHLNNLATMFAAAQKPAVPAAPDRRNLPRTQPARPANLPTPAARPEANSLLEGVKAAKLSKLARAKAERLKQQARLAKNQTEQAPPRTKPVLAKAAPTPGRPPQPVKPQPEAARPQAPQAAAPQAKPTVPPKPRPEMAKPQPLTAPKPAEKPTAAAVAQANPPAGQAAAPPAARPEPAKPVPAAVEPKPAADATGNVSARPTPETGKTEAKAAKSFDSTRAEGLGEVKLNTSLPQLPKLEFKPIVLDQNAEPKAGQRETKAPERTVAEAKATPAQRNDLADIKIGTGLNDMQRTMINPLRPPGERELQPLVEQAGMGFPSQGGGQGGGQQQGRHHQQEEETDQEESEDDAFEGGSTAVSGQALRGERQDLQWWHLKGERPADLKLDMDWLNGAEVGEAALAVSSELRDANQSLRAKEAAPVVEGLKQDELIKPTEGRGQGKFSDQRRQDEQQAPPRPPVRKEEPTPESGPVDHAPDLTGLCSTCGIELGPIDPRRCPRCLKVNALITLGILEKDANFIAYRVFLTACRQPVESLAVYRLRDFSAVPSGAYWVQPVAA